MPEEVTPNQPISGDGVSTIEIKEPGMADEAVDLEKNVMSLLQTESIGSIQQTNQLGRGLLTVAVGVLNGSSARRFDEVGLVEGKTSAGVLATDVGGPTNAAG